jgi:MFS family permease
MIGTHLYVLYEGYGYSVASLYCLGFVSGAVTSPFIGPIVDRIGRRKSAILYCLLEMMINYLEQYDILIGLILSRVVGGITTNLLFSVFEAWLVTEHRKRGFSEDKLEVLMRDSTVTSNMSAIMSGYIAHVLATNFGPVGPFKGAVASTFVALLLVTTKWQENYGSNDEEESKSVGSYMREAFSTITSNSQILRIGVIQGLSDGTLQTFVFLWVPALTYFSSNINSDAADLPYSVWGLDRHGEPAYGLIFGAFMLCGVIGGVAEPTIRKLLSMLLANKSSSNIPDTIIQQHNDANLKKIEEGEEKPVGVEFLAAISYLLCSLLLLTPILVNHSSNNAFSVALLSFLLYEVLIGLYMPCEGVIRTMYMPNDSICSLMTMLRVIINVIVAAGVFSTNFVS